MTTLTAARQDGTLASVTDGNSGTPTIDSMARLITHESYQQLDAGLSVREFGVFYSSIASRRSATYYPKY